MPDRLLFISCGVTRARREPRAATRGARIRILFVGLNYAPEVTGIAPYTTAMAERLVTLGHHVRVVTAFPHYPEWRFTDDGHPATSNRTVNGVEVVRVRHRLPRGTSPLSRLVSELSFGWRAITARWGRPDVVVLVSPALFASAVVFLRALLQRRAVGLWMQDFYGLGVEETAVGDRFGVARTVVSLVERALATRVRGVAVIHEMMVGTALGLGVRRSRIAVIRNWSHVEAPPQATPRQQVRHGLGWSPHEIVVLHTGNMGVKQHLENVVAAARLVDSRALPIRFVLMGDGNARQALERGSAGVASIQFIDPVEERRYAETLAAADVLLVNELPGVRGMAVPSKLTSYFASGRPVVASTDEDSLTADEIARSRAGVVVAAGDPELLIEAAQRLAGDPVEARRLGENGRIYRASHLTLRAAARAFSDWLLLLAPHDDLRPGRPLRPVGAEREAARRGSASSST